MEQAATASDDKIPFPQKFFYGCGAFVNNLLADSIGRMLIVLNLGLGMNPALVGLLGALPRLTDAITDPLMGYISDNTRSRWGRRRPYIFCGAILVGIVFALLWQLPDNRSENYYFWYFLIGSFLFYLAYTIFVTPWVALGYELTPDYHERTRLMGVQNFMGQFAYLLTPWLLVLIQNETYFKNMVDGAGGLAIMLAAVIIGLGVVPAVFLRERFVTPSHTAEDRKAKRQASRRGYWLTSENFFPDSWLHSKSAPSGSSAPPRFLSSMASSWLPHSSTTSLSTTCSAGTL